MKTLAARENPFNGLILASPRRLAMPIAMYPGLALTGACVRDIVTSAQAQVDTQVALHQRYGTPFLMSAMDLSLEAEAFGCSVDLSDSEVPTVLGRLVTTQEQARNLAVPEVGARRTQVALETVRRLRQVSASALVVGGCIGPFSLAARLAGVSEALELTATEPELMHTLVEKGTTFLTAYAQAFKDAGANALLMAEPAAGLLSPRGLATFSSAYIRSLAANLQDQSFTLILHNCGARLVHLPAILETGLKSFHFGAPMDLPGALRQVAPDVVLCGNLDPARVFCQLAPAQVTVRTQALLQATAAHPNFVISSGCDLPPTVPLAQLDAFFQFVTKG